MAGLRCGRMAMGLNMRESRPQERAIPHARLFRRRLRSLRSDYHIALLLKQNLELKALVRALAERVLKDLSPRESRRVLHEVLQDQRRIVNEAMCRHAIQEADTVEDLLAMLAEIDESDARRDREPGR